MIAQPSSKTIRVFLLQLAGIAVAVVLILYAVGATYGPPIVELIRGLFGP